VTSSESTIQSLQERVESIRRREIDRVWKRLKLSPEEKNAVESLSHSIVNQIIPMARMTATSSDSESAAFVDALHRLFKLGERPA